MSIRFRFTIALTMVGVVLFGTYGLFAYWSERDELRAAARREILITGRSLATSTSNALRDRQRADITETLEALESFTPKVDIRVHRPDGSPMLHSPGAAFDREIARMVERSATAQVELVELQPPEDPTRLVYTAPLTLDDDTTIGAIAVIRPVDDLDADLERTRGRLIAVVAGFLIATVVAGMLLGTIHVSRPIARLLEGVRQVRAGEFRSPVPAARRDEIGELVAEFNAMGEALAEARARTEIEAEARARLEQGLQRVDKLVTIGQLSAGLAHEIGSPLQVMSGRASALLEHADPEVQRQAGLLVHQCDRIARVVEQLLAFGRRKPPVIRRCDLTEPIRSVIELLAGEARRRGIELVTAGMDRPHVVEADADQLQQVALNLVKNALAATPPGGEIVVRLADEHDAVALSVEDTGEGIPAETQARLFEPFFTTRATEGGTGLGLAVVRAIATEHRGSVEVVSEPGRGARFTVRFPRTEAP